MVKLDAKHLLFIEPRSPASDEPVIDEYTRRMTGGLRVGHRRNGPRDVRRGVHMCVCRMTSEPFDTYVETTTGRLKTNSLCIHYLAHHRVEVPESELAKVLTLTAEPEDPVPTELARDMRANATCPSF
jgi:hypothetical protein